MNDVEPKSLGSRAIGGMLWAFGSYAGGRVLVLLATAVLARILSPEDFGLVALALTFIGVLEGVSTLGLAQALIVEGDEDLDERADAAFSWGITFGLVASLFVAALSPVIADFFGEPELVGITCALGANFFVRSLGITHYSLAQRQLDFRARTIAEFSDVILRGATGVTLAALGFGAWSLVIGYLVGSIVLAVVIWRLVPWRPRWTWNRQHLPQLLRFGGTLSIVNLVAAVGNTIDNLFVGRVLGPTALGFYRIAFLVPEMSIVNISVVAQRVLFPAMASQDESEMPQSFLTTVRYLWLFSLPAAILLVILAEPVILVAFGDQWLAAVEPMQILTIYGFALATSFAAGTVYAATSRPGVLLYLISARVVLLVGGLLAFTDLGLEAVAACQAVAVGVVEAVGLVMASRLLKVRLSQVWRQVVPSLVGGAVMVAPLIAVERLVDSPWLAVGAGGVAGLAAYAAAIFVVAPDSVAYLRSRIR